MNLLSYLGLLITTLIFSIFALISSLLGRNTSLLGRNSDNDEDITGGSRDLIFSKKKYNRPSYGIDKNNRLVLLNDKNYSDAVSKILSKPLKFPVVRFDNIQKTLKYRSVAKNDIRTSTHNGQLKLLLSEVQFLTDDLSSKKLKYDAELLFIYVGSAPGNHMFMIEKLFPNARFLLIDPNEHCIYYENPDTPEFYTNHSDPKADIEYISNNRESTPHYHQKYVDKFLYFKLAEGNRFGIPDRQVNVYSINKIVKLDRNNEPKKIREINDDYTEGDLLSALFQTNHKYYIIEDFMTDNLSHSIKKVLTKLNRKAYFCSDIRTNESIDETEMPSDADVIINSIYQYNWIKILSADTLEKVMLKFRLPFFIDKKYVDRAKDKTMKQLFLNADKAGLDIYKHYANNKFKYLKGDHINIQAFPGQSSTETRLIISPSVIRNNTFALYDGTEYEEKLFYYNNVVRLYNYFDSNKPYAMEEYGVDCCNDCALMVKIMENYYTKVCGSNDANKLVNQIKNDIIYIIKIMKRTLNYNTYHGNLLKPFKNINEIKDYQKHIIDSL